MKDGLLYARYDAKKGKQPPEGAIPCQDPDPITGHWPHWVRATRPEDVWLREAFSNSLGKSPVEDGTYEAVGPKINGNPEGFTRHVLIKHEGDYNTIPIWEATFHTLSQLLGINSIEGYVFHHNDGVRKCKVKRTDFGLGWPIPKE